VLVHKQLFCRESRTQFNKRTGTLLKFVEYPTEIVIVLLEQITTDKEPEMYLWIGSTLSLKTHCDVKYKNNVIEKDYRGIK
jgi:hypothetical protein